MLYHYLYWYVWRKTRDDWRLAIFRMGGEVISIDWTFKPYKNLFAAKDCTTTEVCVHSYL